MKSPPSMDRIGSILKVARHSTDLERRRAYLAVEHRERHADLAVDRNDCLGLDVPLVAEGDAQRPRQVVVEDHLLAHSSSSSSSNSSGSGSAVRATYA